jgi:hypothetical protein
LSNPPVHRVEPPLQALAATVSVPCVEVLAVDYH